MEIETSAFHHIHHHHPQNNIGFNGGVVLLTNKKLHQENKELLLSEKFAQFQLVECQREKDVLVSEVDLLDRLLKQRQQNNEEEQTRLVQRYRHMYNYLFYFILILITQAS